MSTWNTSKTPPEAAKRRSQRVILSIAITVSTAHGVRDAAFEEETQTLVVNAHGALIALAGKVEKGQKLQLMNRATQAKQDCQVTYLGPASGSKFQIGVEFLRPSPDFWRIAFPPDDWNASERTPVNNKDNLS